MPGPYPIANPYPPIGDPLPPEEPGEWTTVMQAPNGIWYEIRWHYLGDPPAPFIKTRRVTTAPEG